MTNNVYPVARNFPNGLNVIRLSEEMKVVWPPDLADATYTVRGGRPRRGQGIRTGALDIATDRDLTSAEDAAALAHFQTHDGSRDDDYGIKFAALPDPNKVVHNTFFVSDVRGEPGGELGTLLYSSGVAWRRASNNTTVTGAG